MAVVPAPVLHIWSYHFCSCWTSCTLVKGQQDTETATVRCFLFFSKNHERRGSTGGGSVRATELRTEMFSVARQLQALTFIPFDNDPYPLGQQGGYMGSNFPKSR